MITPRDLVVLQTIADFFAVSRVQVQRLCFPEDSSGRTTRRRLQMLVDAKLIQRHPVPIPVNASGSPCPIYFPSRRGCELLAEYLGEESYLGISWQTPQPHLLLHWLAISDCHIVIHEALQRHPEIQCDGWLNEWTTLNPTATAPEQKFRLYSLLDEHPRLVCAPDAAFCLTVRGFSKIFYLEADRNTSGIRQIVNGKTKGYAALAERQLHRRHFPQTNLPDFTVLMVVPTRGRRDALLRALRDAPGSKLWRIADAHELTPERCLTDAIWHDVEGNARPLIKADLLATPNPETQVTEGNAPS